MANTLEIDLASVQTAVVGMATETERNNHMAAMCKQLGLQATFVRSVRCDPGFFGCTVGHIRALAAAVSQGWSNVLILENDCGVTRDFNLSTRVPRDADVVYLGNSSCGCVPDMQYRGVRGCALVSEIEGWSDYFRTDNMTSTHAMLYVSRKGIRAALDSAVRSLQHWRAVDVGFVQELQMGQLNVYNRRDPYFYQASELQSNPDIADVMQKMTLDESPRPLAPGTRLAYAAQREGGSEKVSIILQQDPNGRLVWKRAS